MEQNKLHHPSFCRDDDISASRISYSPGDPRTAGQVNDGKQRLLNDHLKGSWCGEAFLPECT